MNNFNKTFYSDRNNTKIKEIFKEIKETTIGVEGLISSVKEQDQWAYPNRNKPLAENCNQSSI